MLAVIPPGNIQAELRGLRYRLQTAGLVAEAGLGPAYLWLGELPQAITPAELRPIASRLDAPIAMEAYDEHAGSLLLRATGLSDVCAAASLELGLEAETAPAMVCGRLLSSRPQALPEATNLSFRSGQLACLRVYRSRTPAVWSWQSLASVWLPKRR